MNELIILQGALIYALLAWKSYQLSQAGRDLPLRCVVAFLACAAAAYPIYIAYSLHAVPARDHWLMFIQPSWLLACVYCLDLFFLFSLLPPSQAHRRATSRAVVLGLIIAAMAAAAARVTSYSGMSGQADPATDIVYLLFDAGMAVFLIDSWIWIRRGIPHADRTGARGLRVASAGIALMVAGITAEAAYAAMGVSGTFAAAGLARTGNLLVFPGIVVFLAGVAYPTAADRATAMHEWSRHRRTYRELGPLWRSLHELFPEGTLPSRLPSSRWREAITPWHAKRRAIRRQLECRDGLVRISPYIGTPDAANDDIAQRLLTALRTIDPASLRPGKATPIAIPQDPVLSDTDIVADATELVRLAHAMGTARSRDSR